MKFTALIVSLLTPATSTPAHPAPPFDVGVAVVVEGQEPRVYRGAPETPGVIEIGPMSCSLGYSQYAYHMLCKVRGDQVYRASSSCRVKDVQKMTGLISAPGQKKSYK